MSEILCAVGALVGWIVLMLVGTNLTGLVVRGLFPNKEMAALRGQLDPVSDRPLVDAVSGYQRAGWAVTILFALLAVGYLWGLTYFWNAGVAAAAMMLMLSRLPDLLWEIRTRQKVTRSAMPRGAPYFVGNLLSWGALPVLWFAICRI